MTKKPAERAACIDCLRLASPKKRTFRPPPAPEKMRMVDRIDTPAAPIPPREKILSIERTVIIIKKVVKQHRADHLIFVHSQTHHAPTDIFTSCQIPTAEMDALIGAHLPEFGPRFPDVTDLYSASLRMKIKLAAVDAGIGLRQGVYMMFSGPNYETPAEVRMARILGADAVGMSTVPEALVAAQCGIKVLGVSCITNLAAGVSPHKLSHEEVMETSIMAHDKFHSLLDLILKTV